MGTYTSISQKQLAFIASFELKTDELVQIAAPNLPTRTMSVSKEKLSMSNDMEKDQALQELGDVVMTGEVLSAEEDRRILRKIDMQFVLLLSHWRVQG